MGYALVTIVLRSNTDVGAPRTHPFSGLFWYWREFVKRSEEILKSTTTAQRFFLFISTGFAVAIIVGLAVWQSGLASKQPQSTGEAGMTVIAEASVAVRAAGREPAPIPPIERPKTTPEVSPNLSEDVYDDPLLPPHAYIAPDRIIASTENSPSVQTMDIPEVPGQSSTSTSQPGAIATGTLASPSPTTTTNQNENANPTASNPGNGSQATQPSNLNPANPTGDLNPGWNVDPTVSTPSDVASPAVPASEPTDSPANSPVQTDADSTSGSFETPTGPSVTIAQ